MEVVEGTSRAMASHVQIIVVGGSPEIVARGQRMVNELESAWSRFRPTSDISRLNNAHGRMVSVHPATLRLIDTMNEAAALTNGRFAATVLRPLMAAGYTTSVEDPCAVTVLPPASSPGQQHGFEVTLEVTTDPSIALPVGAALDPGGVGKGLAADLVVAELLANGAAGCLVSIGGDLAAAGTPPPDGWHVEIEDHLDVTRMLARVSFSGGGIATSSTRTRSWPGPPGSQPEHHLIDPRTDRPSRSDIVAVTVIAGCGWQAEAHTKGVLLGGSADFDRYTADHGLDAVATTVSGQTLATDTLAELIALGPRS